MIKGTAAHEEDARGAEMQSEGVKEDKANKALNDLSHQLEARLRNKKEPHHAQQGPNATTLQQRN